MKTKSNGIIGEERTVNCGHQGETDCYGQCVFLKMFYALEDALENAGHEDSCPVFFRSSNECMCWRSVALEAHDAALDKEA